MDSEFGDVIIIGGHIAQATRNFTYRFARKNGWWLSELFGNSAWLIRYNSNLKTFSRCFVRLSIPSNVDYDKFEKHVRKLNNLMYARHKNLLLGIKKKKKKKYGQRSSF